MNTSEIEKSFKSLSSQEANIHFRKYQDVVKGLSFDAITLNEKIIEVNSQIKQIRLKQAALYKKRDIVGLHGLEVYGYPAPILFDVEIETNPTLDDVNFKYIYDVHSNHPLRSIGDMSTPLPTPTNSQQTLSDISNIESINKKARLLRFHA